ncbi:MAG TPA: Hsp70 family protein, partial [Myxococcales bacterium]
GDDFDRALAEILLQGKERTPRLVREAIDAAKAAKEELTLSQSAKALGRTVTRADLEAAIQPLIEKTGNACRRALRDAGVPEGKGLDGVILVGGSTRVPAVRRFVAELFGMQPLADIDPDEVVALGAAVQADLLTSESPQHDVLLLDVTPLSLGLETMGGLAEKIILRNTTIPASAGQEFTTFADGQNGMDIHVVQGERELVADCRSLARFTLSGIPPLPAGLARVKVIFQVDADGILSVTAREELTGVSQSITVKPSHGLSDDEIERMLLSSIENAEADVQARLLIDNRIEAQRILKAAEGQLQNNGDLLSPEERAPIEAAMKALREAAEGKDHHLIHDRIERLDHQSAEFAKRVMDRGIERALKGHSVGEFDHGELSPHAQKAYSALKD